MKTVFNKVKANISSGLAVALVSIPLSVSLAVASNTSPVVGILTAIWAGLIASIFGGSNFNIVGPTGALSGILATYAITHGAGSLPTLSILVGLFILVSYMLKLERLLIYIPKSAIQGFTLGVAFIIGLNQLNSAFGLKVTTVHERFIHNLVESLQSFDTMSFTAVTVFALFLFGLFVLAKVMPKVPGAILLTPIGILLGYLSTNNIVPLAINTLGQKFPELAPKLFVPWNLTITSDLLATAITVAVIAIIETMLSAKIADGMTKTKHQKRKEIFGLSLANIGAGLFGGMPATAALARTSLNIKAGATDKMSATISSISIVLISFLLLTTFKYIPMAVIAAILVFVAIRMVEVHELKHMFTHDKTAFYVAMFVALVTVYEDPIVGILVGTVVSLVLVVRKISEGQFELMVNNVKTNKSFRISRDEEIELNKHDHTLVYTVKGKLVYMNAQAHISRFEHKLNGSKVIILRLRELYYIDLDGVEAIDEIIEICEQQNREIYITGVNDFILRLLKNSKNYLKLDADGKVFSKTTEVLAAIKGKTE